MARPPGIENQTVAPAGVWPPVSAETAPAAVPASGGGIADAPQLEGYRLVSPLGQGGMGTVWRAMQLSSGREVALKLIRGGFFGSPRARARFDREVELLARLEHPHIARLYHSGVYQGTPFYAMELIDGVPLDQFVRGRALPHHAILDLLATVARAIDYAHRKGVIHRDLKPSNILVDADGSPHIVDFGLGKFLQHEAHTDLSLDGVAAGTLEYMSPEQAAGEHDRVDRGSDVYSLGVVLYELLTGRFPHGPIASRFELQQSIIEEEPHRPRTISRDIDSELESLLLKALAKQPADRYSTAEALAEDVEAYRRGDPLRARPLTLSYLARKRLRKHRRPIAAAVALGVALASGAGLAWHQIDAAQLAAESSRARAERSSYASHITLAAAELDRQDVAKATLLLDTAPPSMRAWEWRHLRHAADGSRLTIEAAVRKLAVSADGGRVLGQRPDGTLATWSAASGQPLGSLDVRASQGEIVALAAGGEFLLARRENRLTVLTLDGEAVHSFEVRAEPRLMAISPNGASVAVLDAAGTLSLSGADEKPRAAQLTGPAESFYELDVSDTGVTAYAVEHGGRGAVVRVHQPDTFATVGFETSPGEQLKGLTLLPDGSGVAVADQTGEVVLYSLPEGRRRWAIRLDASVYNLYAPAGGREIWAGTRAGLIWCSAGDGTRTGAVYGIGPVSGGMIGSGPSGGVLVASDGAQMKVWHRGDQPVSATAFPMNEPAVSAAWSGSGTLTVTGVLGSTFDVRHEVTRFVPRPKGQRFAVTSVGAPGLTGNHLVVTDDGRVGRAAAAGVQWLGRLGDASKTPWQACIDPNGLWLLAWDIDGNVVSWDVTKEAAEPRAEFQVTPAGIVTDAAGNRILYADRSQPDTLRLRHADTLDEVVSIGVGGKIERLALSGDGEVAVAGLDGDRLVVVDESGAKFSEVRASAGYHVLTLDHGGTRLVVGGYTLTLFDTLTGQPMLTLSPYRGARLASFSPDDAALAVVGARTVTVWRAPP